ncbi:MAG: mechanosensitive ion channel family protein [Bacteroidetes bacterium]|nr:mechanosensitive ion channel family protein [Bacteroidota bacterium]
MDIKNTKSSKPEKATTKNIRHKNIWFGTWLGFALIFLTAYFLLRLSVFHIFGGYLDLVKKCLLGAFFSSLILAASKILEKIILKRAHRRHVSYNLIKLLRLMSILLICFVIITFLFKNWYTAAVSLGLISLILGFALQTPISSFIGWINILIRAPYHVGDRIQIEEFKGDVVEINYLDTTLWEFGGDYLTNDVPSGRLIRFPNSMVFESAIYNYSWQKFPYIWNEIPFHVAYESDLGFITDKIKTVARKELGKEMEANIEEFKELVKQTPVDELDIKEYPFVSYRINTNTWVELTLTYLVEPKMASGTRSNLIKKILEELVKYPDKAMFPKSNAR